MIPFFVLPNVLLQGYKGVVALEKHNVEHQFKRASVNISLTVSN